MSARPLVFVPGLQGSTLRSADGRLRFFGAAAALALSSPELSLPLRFEGATQARDGLRAGEPLSTVALVPGLLEVPVYRPFLDAVAAAGRELHAFAYDWRRDLHEAAAGLERALEALAPARPQLVGHSLGGLVSLAVALRRPDLVSSLALVGSPLRGGVGFLLDLHVGTRAGLNPWLLSPEVLSTFPSVYALFPSDGRGLIDERGAPLAIDWHDVESWRRRGLGRYTRGTATAEFDAYLAWALDRAQSFRASLAGRLEMSVLIVRGARCPTLTRVVLGGPRSVRGWDFATAPRDGGDGRVAYADAGLPAAVEAAEVHEASSDYSHTALLGDPAVVRALAARA